MANTIITQAGLNYCISASNSGPAVFIKYFVPVYDYRLDPFIHDTSIQSSAINQIANYNATSPFGELIWHVSASEYSMSPEVGLNYIISAGLAASANHQITNPVQSRLSQINLRNNKPLSNHWYATSADFIPASKSWSLSGATQGLSIGDNTPEADNVSKYWRVVDYSPVTDGTGVRGNFKCLIRDNIGQAKFNKIALYAVRVNVNGVETGEPPIYFGETILKTTVMKSDYGNGGFEEIMVDSQIQLHSISANADNIFYSTSADYWMRAPGGLYYPEKVGIGNFNDGVNAPFAKLEVRSQNINQMALSYDDSKMAIFGVDNAGNIAMSAYGGKFGVNTTISPFNQNADLGDQLLSWRNLYARAVRAGIFQTSLPFHLNITPGSNRTYDLGSNAAKFLNGYVDNINTSAINVGSSITPMTNNIASIGNQNLNFYAVYTNAVANTRDGDLKLGAYVVPWYDGIGGIGKSSRRWNTGYFGALDANSLNAGSINSTGSLVVNGSISANSNVSVAGNLNATEIEASDGIFSNIYINSKSNPIGVLTPISLNFSSFKADRISQAAAVLSIYSINFIRHSNNVITLLGDFWYRYPNGSPIDAVTLVLILPDKVKMTNYGAQPYLNYMALAASGVVANAVPFVINATWHDSNTLYFTQFNRSVFPDTTGPSGQSTGINFQITYESALS